MAIARKPEEQTEQFDAHRLEMIRIAREVNERIGAHGEPEITPKELRQRMIDRGLRPEDNICSREIMRMRYGDDCQEE